jgi:hypothetical protein
MLTPRRRALFEASFSALLLASDSAEPASAAPGTGVKQGTNGMSDNELDGASRPDRPRPVASPDPVEGGL